MTPLERRTPEPFDFTRSFRTERGAERFLAGRQFLVITIVFLIAQLTSFHDVLTFPLTDVTIPPLLKPVISDFSLGVDTERQRGFRRIVKWRTGCEGRISHLKRNYSWDRTMIDTTEGARIWTGHGVLAHNLIKISALAG